ncbi:MAG: hypothetical protein EAZ92_14300 [Candidatus Kapaibacterium sp.]|nr:MAG: hypothetical protein EAZ92_14300 [Candidatus Kapabacteria bacterium]
MEQLQTLSTVRGRIVLRDIFRELRYEKQVSGFTALLTCWRLCTFEREAYRYSSKRQVTVIHALGLFRGTSLFLQEIVNRFYFSTINSLVYLGAAILLLIVSASRFSDKVDNRAILAGVALEALMLFILFVVMFFSPSDDIELEASVEADSTPNSASSDIRELIAEVGEISADYAAFTERLDNVTSSLSGMISRQDELIGAVNDMARSVSLASTPQPEFIESMRQTNLALQAFHKNVHDLVEATNTLRREEIQRAVRVEVERILTKNVE